MHDIGKVRTPLEVLNKPDKLTDAEFTIMKRHTVDGAEILRATPDIPALVPVVAFEHHLRIDGTGYPTAVKRPDAQRGHDALQHCRRLRRHAIPAELPAVVPERPGPRSLEAQRRTAVRSAPGAEVRRSWLASTRRETRCGSIRANWRLSSRSMRLIRIGRRSASSSIGRASGSTCRTTSTCGRASPTKDGRSAVAKPIDSAELGIDPLVLL